MMNRIKLAITGGIGSGKSVVSHILSIMGIPVYDCDSRAKILMENDIYIRQSLIRMFGEECYDVQGKINRKWLAARIFVDKDAIQRVNALVHPRVKTDFLEWAENQNSAIVAVETAILYESGMNDIVDKTLLVWAATDTCIKRVEGRSGMTQRQVLNRINNQMSADDLLLLCDYAVHNDDDSAVMPQILEVLDDLKKCNHLLKNL